MASAHRSMATGCIRIVCLALLVSALAIPVAARAQSAAQAGEALMLAADAERMLDEAQDRKDSLEQAARVLVRALTLDDSSAAAYVQVCRLQILGGPQAGRIFAPMGADTARKAVNKAIALDPYNGYARVLSAHLFVQNDRLADAKLELLEAQRIGTASPWLALNWAQVYEREMNDAVAARYYETVVKSGTSDRRALAIAYERLARIAIANVRWARAEEYHARHLQLEPDNVQARVDFALALAFAGEFERALPHAREAMRLRGNDAARHALTISLYGRWATLVMADSDPQAAAASLQEAQAAMPDMQHVAAETYPHPRLRIIAQALAQQHLVVAPAVERIQ